MTRCENTVNAMHQWHTEVTAAATSSDAQSKGKALLRVVKTAEGLELACVHKSEVSFFQRFLAFFGAGSLALKKVVAVAQSVISSGEISSRREQNKLSASVGTLNNKIEHYAKKHWFHRATTMEAPTFEGRQSTPALKNDDTQESPRRYPLRERRAPAKFKATK